MFKSIKCEKQIRDFLDEVLNDVFTVFEFGATKHPDSGDTPNFLTVNGNKCSHKQRHDSCFHHLASSFCHDTKDPESGLNPLLHLIASAAILYIRQKHDIVHPEDKDNQLE